MNRICFLLVIPLLLFTSAVFSQKPERTPPVWKPIESPREEINFEIPDSNFEQHLTDQKDFVVSLYRAEIGDSVLTLRTQNFDSFTRTIFEFAAKYDPKCASSADSRFTYYECDFTESDTFSHSFRIILSAKRMYMFYAYSNGKHEPEVARFLNSAVAVREPENKKSMFTGEIGEYWSSFEKGGFEKPAPIPEVEPKDIPQPINPGKATDVPIQLLTKAQPKYSEPARLFSVTGHVRLRVTFLSNGRIGDVSAFKRLPFGLTDEAIIAAKKIRFNPEIRNGMPVGVIKTVVYKFTIY